MHAEDLSRWTHAHDFNLGYRPAERGARRVLALTLAAMALEIGAGWWTGSMALLADGWHMSSHALAIGLSVFAYAAARRLARDQRFAFGTWKIEVLAGFASAVLLLAVAAMMVTGSIERLLAPQPIRHAEAMAVALLGLAVNVASALLLTHTHGHHHHGHAHDDHAPAHTHTHTHTHDGPPDGHARPHEDMNLKAAYLHVLADAATSVLAIAALAGGWLWGWDWLDPLTGMAGAVLVGVWAKGLIVQTAKVLLDREMDAPVVAEIRDAIENPPDAGATRVADLHVWRVAPHAYACAITVVTHDTRLTPDALRQRLAVHGEVVHATIEIQHCPAPAP
ncbi:cation transporter [Comamonadaceae bacterium OH2545_COT-014]|nr:cation transporter [Comamonadaceae bacterium OH2545_COT-014]